MEFLHAKGGKLYCGAQPILLRGMGLGGWLLPEGYMWKFYTKCDRPRRIEALIERLCGVEYAASFWAQYFATYITEEDIAWIAAQGMNSVRLALNSRLLFEVAPDGTATFRASALHLVDSCVAWCKRHGIYVILDMHGAPGGQTGQNIDDCEHNRPELFTNEAHQDTLVEMWKLLAQHYREEPAIGGATTELFRRIRTEAAATLPPPDCGNSRDRCKASHRFGGAALGDGLFCL